MRANRAGLVVSWSVLTGLIVGACGVAAQPAGPPPPCSERPGYDTLDFWLGSWDVFLPDGKRAGENQIEKVLSGCAIQETWRGATGFEGRSLFFRTPDRVWRQVWVTSGGAVKEKRLVPSEAGVRFQGEIPRDEGSPLLDRTTLTVESPDRVRQLIEQSEDGGQTWAVVFDGRYRRRPAGDAAPDP